MRRAGIQNRCAGNDGVAVARHALAVTLPRSAEKRREKQLQARNSVADRCYFCVALPSAFASYYALLFES